MGADSLWHVPAVSLLVWIAGFPFSSPYHPRRLLRPLLIGALAALTAYLITLPHEGVFQPGQALGWGVVAGTAAATLAFLPVVGVATDAQAGHPRASASAIAPILACLWLLLRLRFADRILAVGGVGAGWTVTAFLVAAMGQSGRDSRRMRAVATMSSVVATTLCLQLALAFARAGNPQTAHHWTTLLLDLSTVGVLTVLLASVIRDRPSSVAAAIVRGALSAVAIAAGTGLLLHAFGAWLRIERSVPALTAAIICAVAGAVAMGAMAVSRQARVVLWDAAILVLLGCAIIAPAMQILVGTGAAMAALSALFVLTAMVLPSALESAELASDRATLLLAAALLPPVALLVVRLASNTADGVFIAFGVTDHVQTLTLVLFAVLPGIIAELPGTRWPWLGSIVALAAATVAPALAAIVWGGRVAYSMLVGLGLSGMLVLSYDDGEDSRQWVPLLSIVMMAAVLHGVPVVLHATALPRSIRAAVAMAILLLLVVPPWVVRARRTRASHGGA